MIDTAVHTNYQSELKYPLEDKGRLDYISNLCNSIKDTGNTLILVDRISAGNELASRISDSVLVSGSTKSADRKTEYDEVSTANSKVIIATYGVVILGLIFLHFSSCFT